MSQWPTMRLGEVLRRSQKTVEPQPNTEYREVTVRLWGNGVVERARILGASLSGRRFVARAGQFIASRIDARNGAMGLVPESLDGALVTNDFPLFELDAKRLEPAFLGWLCRTQGFVDLCLRASEGTTNRVRLKEDRFLALEIPLPPLAEQRRVVARIQELADQIHEARSLRYQAAEEAEALSATASAERLRQIKATAPLGELIEHGSSISYGVLVPGPEVADGVPFIRIQDLDGTPERPSKRIAPEIEKAYARTRLQGGEVLVAVVGATIGKVAVAPFSWRGANIARAVCRIRPKPKVDRDFLALVLKSQDVQDYFRTTTRTLAQPTLNVGQLERTQIPLPPLADQRRIVAELDAFQAQVDTLKHLQTETAAELDALLPAILDRAFKGEM